MRLAYEAGASDAEVMKIMKCTAKQFEKRYAENTEFRTFIDVGRMMAKAWWYEQARLNLQNKSFQGSLWFTNMRNRYGWSDKPEAANGEAPLDQLSDSEMQAKLVGAMRKVLKSMKKDGLTEADLLRQFSGTDH